MFLLKFNVYYLQVTFYILFEQKPNKNQIALSKLKAGQWPTV